MGYDAISYDYRMKLQRDIDSMQPALKQINERNKPRPRRPGQGLETAATVLNGVGILLEGILS